MIMRATSLCLFAAITGVYQTSTLNAQTTQAARSSTSEAAKGIAVSLRAVGDAADSPELMHLFGSTRLLGFLGTEDELGLDCILVLAKEFRRPELRFDDLAVAYRNVVAGKARPACTIDPRIETLRKLSEVAQRVGSAHDEQSIQRHLREWERIGTGPQDVQVFNVDPETHFAAVMVKADYDLKSICDGTTRIRGITSLTDRLARRVQTDIARTGTTSMPVGSQNRFWFNAGRITYQADNGLFLLGTCEVQLLTEEEAMTHEGERAGKSRANPLAQEFADDLTEQFGNLAKSKPLFRELKNLYRAVAIMTLLHEEAHDQRDLVRDAFRSVDIPRMQFNRTLAGRVSVKKLQGNLSNGRWQLFLPSCGGVSIAIDRHSMVRENAPAAALAAVAKRITDSRPAYRTLSWKVAL